MRSWKENFGNFWTNSCDWEPKKKIFICTRQDMTGEEMVNVAIMLAKKYQCKIVSRVEYNNNADNSGGVSFLVECDSKTYRLFHDGGRTSKPRSSEIKESDIIAYQEKFGTRKCADDTIGKNRYFFKDNWDGRTLYFPSLKKAKEAALKQTGCSCCIYEIQPYGRGSDLICFAPASCNSPS